MYMTNNNMAMMAVNNWKYIKIKQSDVCDNYKVSNSKRLACFFKDLTPQRHFDSESRQRLNFVIPPYVSYWADRCVRTTTK